MTDKERIEKDALYYAHKDSPGYRGYIAGATAEHERYIKAGSTMLPQIFHEQMKQVHNKAIDECINTLNNYIEFGYVEGQSFIIKAQLESLKSNPEAK